MKSIIDELFFPGPVYHNRLACELCKFSRLNSLFYCALTSKSCTNKGRDHSYCFTRHPKVTYEAILQWERGLGGGPHSQLSIFNICKSGMGFNCRVCKKAIMVFRLKKMF